MRSTLTYLFLPLDYTLNNPDTLTKYKTAAGIAQKVLENVKGMCVLLPTTPDMTDEGAYYYYYY